MVTKKDLKDFAEFCYLHYGIEIHGFIIEGFFKENNLRNTSETKNKISKVVPETECGLNNVKCVYVSFDSAKCNDCPN